jgi:hypothetical protein
MASVIFLLITNWSFVPAISILCLDFCFAYLYLLAAMSGLDLISLANHKGLITFTSAPHDSRSMINLKRANHFLGNSQNPPHLLQKCFTFGCFFLLLCQIIVNQNHTANYGQINQNQKTPTGIQEESFKSPLPLQTG